MSQLLDESLGRPVMSSADIAYAHTPGDSGRWHLFADHARSVGELAGRFAAKFGAELWARLIGYTHDLGKLTAPAQQALRDRAVDHGPRLGVPHKVEGAALAWMLKSQGEAAVAAMALANLGHHSGIPSRKPMLPDLFGFMQAHEGCLDEFVDRLECELDVDVREILAGLRVPPHLADRSPAAPRYDLDLFARMLHSALVDADFLDTSAHFRGEPSPRLYEGLGMAKLRDHFMQWYADRFGKPENTDLNRLRAQVFDSCVGAGQDESMAAARGIYRLPAQTGSGKTMAAAGFALNHAAKFGKDRVIVAVPFTSITTQNAAAYREAFADLGDHVVLEHHSNVIDPDQADSSWRRLSAENWDAEFIVTTTVQLFESLFSGRPAAARKLHRIANSVVVIDEVQALPLELVPSILRMLRQLVEHYGVTVLLASATQPTFWELDVWDGLEPLDILPIGEIPEATRRVEYEVRAATQSWEDLAEELARADQVLTIVNTTSDAKELSELLRETGGDDEVLHLSTRMCGEHRLATLDEVRRRLQSGERIRLVSTQLIEAGVDVDFPLVYRALAPADSVVQSAGRCNREGALGHRGGRVVVFQPRDGGKPGGHYSNLTQMTASKFVDRGDQFQFGEPAAMSAYYRDVMQTIHGSGRESKSTEVDRARHELDFPKVHEGFQMIEDRTGSVVVTTYGPETDRREVSRLLEHLHEDPTLILSRSDRRLLQRYSAGVPKRILVGPLADEVSDGVYQWFGGYDDVCGVVLDRVDGTIW